MSLFDESEYEREIRRESTQNYYENQLTKAKTKLLTLFTPEQAKAIINFIEMRDEFKKSFKK